MKHLLLTSLVLFCFAAVAFSYIQSSSTIRVAVAANLSYPMQQIKENFELAHPNINIEIISASSGKLTAQIIHRAPFHIFISANMQYPESLFQNGKTLQEPVIITYGSAVGWHKKSITNSNDLVSLLLSTEVRNIAIAEPDLAPYGKVAQEWLMANSIWEQVKPKLVYGENVGKVNQYIYAESVDFAFTAASASQHQNMKEKGSWIELKNQKGIPHGGMILNYGLENEKNASNTFFEFLFTEKAQQVLQHFGYQSINY